MRLVVVSLALAGCSFRPGATASSDGDIAPDDARTDTSLIDAPPDGIPVDMAPPLDARACYGAGLGAVCLTTPPTLPRVLVGTFDTGGTVCDEVISGLCVLAGTDVTVVTATNFRAIGTRPLVIVATNTLLVDGGISVTSNATESGAGASSATCAGPVSGPVNDVGGAGGGAGGSFGGRGGNGGLGDNNNNGGGDGDAPGAVSATAITLTTVRAGCPGSLGGIGDTDVRGAAGTAGGAVYLIAGASITVGGVITSGGRGGNGSSNGSGGGGGGSGGLIGLDAPTITVTGTLAANGGGGGGGGTGNSTLGLGGGNGRDDATAAAGGDGAGIDGGNGATGSVGATVAGPTAPIGNGGGGGGGGGAGFIYAKGTATLTGTVTPPATLAP